MSTFRDWQSVSYGRSFAVAMSGNGTWYVTGINNKGQLGSGNTTNVATFTPLTGNWGKVVAGGYHMMALSAGTTKLFATGDNQYGQHGIGDEGNFRTSFTQVTGDWSNVVCGDEYTFALSAGTNNKWFGCGWSDLGQLGLAASAGSTPFSQPTFVQMLNSPSFITVHCGLYTTFALSASNVPRWLATGRNTDGRMGIGNITSTYSVTAIPGNWSKLVAGGGHTMALSAGTTKLFATGDNLYGQLGLGDIADRTSFAQVPGDWSDVECGFYSSYAKQAGTNKWYSTGWNNNGQLGLGLPTTVGTYLTAFSAMNWDWFAMDSDKISTSVAGLNVPYSHVFLPSVLQIQGTGLSAVNNINLTKEANTSGALSIPIQYRGVNGSTEIYLYPPSSASFSALEGPPSRWTIVTVNGGNSILAYVNSEWRPLSSAPVAANPRYNIQAYPWSALNSSYLPAPSALIGS
jgi:alpha-tubulin suppressor-like RCC1 family protein